MRRRVDVSREDGVKQIAVGCTKRLLEIGLPEDQALKARDIVAAYVENFADRLLQGEWEPK
jgi:hypothetical protein